MHGAAQDALRIVAELNTGYRTPQEARALLSELTGKEVDKSVALFPPLYSEFGKNLTLGKDVFINLGCRFQDTGGITIGDGTLIGHGSTLTTLNHSVDPGPASRHDPGADRDRSQSMARRNSDSRPRRRPGRRSDRRRRRRRDAPTRSSPVSAPNSSERRASTPPRSKQPTPLMNGLFDAADRTFAAHTRAPQRRRSLMRPTRLIRSGWARCWARGGAGAHARRMRSRGTSRTAA